MIPYKKHPFIKKGSQVSRGVMPREIIGPRSIVRKGPVREGGIFPSHFFNKAFPIWPKTEKITIPSYKSLPKKISFTDPFAKGRFGLPIRPVTISTHKTIPSHKSSPKSVTSTNIASDSGLIGAGMGTILSVLLYLM